VTEFLLGLGLGLGAGLSPGPLQTLVVTSALRRGFGAGVRVAIAPLLTDAPIIALTVAVVSTIPDRGVRAIGIAGGLALVAMGIWEIARARRHSTEESEMSAGSDDVLRGVIVNGLNPHPWLFWIGVGAPLLVTAWRVTPGRALAYLAGFYLTIIGSKVAIAGVVAVGRQRLSIEWRYRLLLAGGALLVIFGLLLALRA
jgi:threonine/homoserine/homoserine lactone efflux protein